jgi:hypothetical protein
MEVRRLDYCTFNIYSQYVKLQSYKLNLKRTDIWEERDFI